MISQNYRKLILDELARHRFTELDDNFDRQQRGDEPPLEPSMIKKCWGETRERVRLGTGLGGKLSGLRPLARAIAYYFAPYRYFSRYAAEQIAYGEFLYSILDDEPSRTLLLKLIAYRILGYRKIKLPRNTPQYWDDIERLNCTITNDEPIAIKFMDARLAMHDLSTIGYDVRCHATNPGLACAVVQKQYEYHSAAVHCKAEPGDVVIDAGGCWGETTMYFAHEAAPNGAVVAFEFIPSNLAVLRRNMELNPHLNSLVTLVEAPIWSTSGKELYYVDWGPGSRVTDDIKKYHSWEGTTRTVTIDDTIARLSLPRVDFVKMDIEGAELEALRGGEQSLRRWRPKLAISLYHNPEDFETIPRYLHGLGLGYRFYLDHHTIYENETVLFAVPEKQT